MPPGGCLRTLGKFREPAHVFVLKQNATHIQGTLAKDRVPGTVGLEQRGKVPGILEIRLGDKIKPLSCWDWDPSSMFPLWMAF